MPLTKKDLDPLVFWRQKEGNPIDWNYRELAEYASQLQDRGTFLYNSGSFSSTGISANISLITEWAPVLVGGVIDTDSPSPDITMGFEWEFTNDTGSGIQAIRSVSFGLRDAIDSNNYTVLHENTVNSPNILFLQVPSSGIGLEWRFLSGQVSATVYWFAIG